MDRRTRLSSSKEWQLVHEDQDIRGWDALDFAGRPMGTVNDLILNTRTKLVEIVELTDGREYHAQKVEIGDGVIYIDTTALEDGVVYIHTLLRDHEENLKRLETA